MRIVTVGHSIRTLEDFLAMLERHGVGGIADVRRYPGSRRHPHFGRDALAQALEAAGIRYEWLQGLGGRRRSRPDSPHTAWRVQSFAAYADHMETAEFADGVSRLLALAAERLTAIMCSEARPEQCHRRLISDWLVVHGVEVVHLVSPARAVPHRLTDFARVEGDRIVYDKAQLELPRDSSQGLDRDQVGIHDDDDVAGGAVAA